MDCAMRSSTDSAMSTRGTVAARGELAALATGSIATAELRQLNTACSVTSGGVAPCKMPCACFRVRFSCSLRR